MFCSKCGNIIEDDDVFCVKCGSKTKNAVEKVIEPEEVFEEEVKEEEEVEEVVEEEKVEMAEPVLFVLPINYRKGIGMKSGALVITQKRFIMAHVTNAMAKRFAIEAKEKAKQAGKGKIKTWGSIMVSGYIYIQEMYNREAAHVFNDCDENFNIYFDSIIKVKLIKQYSGYNPEDGTNNNYDMRIYIKTAGKQFKFRATKYVQDQKQLIEILKRYIGGKLKVR